MRGYDYNDYELIYLIRDGNQKALKLLFEKYSFLTKKVCKGYINIYSDKYDDLVQEGLLTLEYCLRRYNPDKGASFFTYFTISLQRNLSKLSQNSYFSDKHLLFDSEVVYRSSDSENYFYVIFIESFFSNEIDRALIRECYLGDSTTFSFSKRYNISYYIINKKCKYIDEVLKKILTIDLN